MDALRNVSLQSLSTTLNVVSAIAFDGASLIRVLRVPSVAAFKRMTGDATVPIHLHPSLRQLVRAARFAPHGGYDLIGWRSSATQFMFGILSYHRHVVDSIVPSLAVSGHRAVYHLSVARQFDNSPASIAPTRMGNEENRLAAY